MGSDFRSGVLVILDGFGVNPNPKYNAIALANHPTLNRLYDTYPHGTIEASEQNVGLPGGFMGNSEVGHLNIGAGRIVYQDLSLISRSIQDGSFFQNAALSGLMQRVATAHPPTTLHLVGLVSDGGVHSHISHLFALLRMAKELKVARCMVHVITDGRDTSPVAGADFIQQLESFMGDLGYGEIATASGRFYAMDRDKRWERTESAFKAMVNAKAEKSFGSAREAVADSYRAEITDEFILPSVAKGYEGIEDGDGVIFFNFRADRMRQIVRAITQSDFDGFKREGLPALAGSVCMSMYEEGLNLPVAFERPKVSKTLGELVSARGEKQLRIAETEKYAHVTYFFNGGEEKVFNGEKRLLIPSPKEVRTYDLKPEMSAPAVTDLLIKELKEENYRMVVVNFANCDMVGHTGNLRAAVSAVETVDKCLARLVEWVEESGGFAIITADHGNCEMMMTDDGRPMTAHTLLPVPFIVVDKKKKGAAVRRGGKLCDIAPTMLSLWGWPIPPEMTGTPLL